MNLHQSFFIAEEKGLLPPIVFPGKGRSQSKNSHSLRSHWVYKFNSLMKDCFQRYLNVKTQVLSHPGFLIAEEKGLLPLIVIP
jgi:hypothetical protein